MAKAIINSREIFGNVHLGEGGDVANPNIADVYDPTQTYNTGDRRIYDNVLYVCNDDNVTGTWDSTKWDSATIDEIISALTADDIPYSSGVSVADKIDELDAKTGEDIPVASGETETIAEAIGGVRAVSRYSATGSAYGSFSFKEINGIKFVLMRNLTGLAANALTTLDFTLPETMRPIEDVCYFDVRQPSSDYTVRLIINPSGVVQIYNYGSTTGALNVSFIGSYV